MATDMKELLQGMVRRYDIDVTGGWHKSIQFVFTGEKEECYYVQMDGDRCDLIEGVSQTNDLKLKVDPETWAAIAGGRLKGAMAVLKGKLKPQGDLSILTEIRNIFSKVGEGDIWDDANALWVRDRLDEAARLSAEGLAELQQEKFHKMLRHAVDNCPFYRNLYREIDIETASIQELPTIDKTMVMNNFEDIVTDSRLNLAEIRAFLNNLTSRKAIYENEFVVGATSGTTGTPGVFCYSFAEWRTAMLSNTRGMDEVAEKEAQGILTQDGGDGDKYRFAMITSPNIESLSAITAVHLPTWLTIPKVFSTLATNEELVEQLNEFQPDIVCGHTSRILDLAYEQMAGRLRVKLTRISTFAEFLSDAARRLLEEVFETEVFNRYQASELMNIGWECSRHEGIHVNSDLVLLESVDESNRPVPRGERGSKLLITNLYNYTQPLIRYELSDLVTFSTKTCSCGLPFALIDRIEGRNDGILKFKNGKGETICLYPYDIEMTFSEISDIKSFQVIQKSDSAIEVRVVPTGDPKDAISRVKENVQEELLAKAGLAGAVDVQVEGVEEIPRDRKTGKFRRIINETNAALWGYSKKANLPAQEGKGKSKSFSSFFGLPKWMRKRSVGDKLELQ
jgi:phenylacetate-coenzyme A ligase PaaK-like adenylate-forming protein/putative sterol carrier protein